MTSKIELEALNRMNAEDFTHTLAEIFEHSPWIPARAYGYQPFESIEGLHAALVAEVKKASNEKQLDLLCAHPELAGKEAKKGELTLSSTDEQSSAGLNSLSQTEMESVKKFNEAYKEKFEFPFIIAVRNHTRESIFDEWEKRLDNSREVELKNCLEQVYRIAKIRLDSLIIS